MLLIKAARVVRPISNHRLRLFSSRAIRSSPPAFRSMSSTHVGESTLRPEPDRVLQDIADYVHGYNIKSDLAFETARLCLIDTIGCGLEALRFPECTKLLGPVVEGTIVPNGLNFYIYITTVFLCPSFRHSHPRYKLSARSYPRCLQHWRGY